MEQKKTLLKSIERYTKILEKAKELKKQSPTPPAKPKA